MSQQTFRDAALQAEFDEHGLVQVDLMQGEDVAELRRLFNRYTHHHTSGFSATLLTRDLDYRRAAYEAISGVMADRLSLLLEDHAIFTASFACKGPQQPEAALHLHQDMSFTDESLHGAVNVWCPLCDVGPDNGWLGVVPGSFRFNPRFREPGQFVNPELWDLIQAEYAVHCRLRAGQAWLYHPRTFHWSPGNVTDQLRAVAVATLAPRSARLVYCHRDYDEAPNKLDLFEVTPDFYLSHMIGLRPQGAIWLKQIERVVDPLTQPLLDSLITRPPARADAVESTDTSNHSRGER